MSSWTKKLQQRKALIAKRDEIDKKLRELDHELFPRIEQLAAAIDGEPLPKGGLEQLTAIAINVPRQRPKTIIVEAEKVLKEANRPMQTRELYEVLKARGVEVPGKIPQNNLSAHLALHKNIFGNDGRNGWFLRQPNLVDPEKPNAHAQH